MLGKTIADANTYQMYYRDVWFRLVNLVFWGDVLEEINVGLHGFHHEVIMVFCAFVVVVFSVVGGIFGIVVIVFG